MCLICIDFDRGALELSEARRALGEMRVKVGAEHAAVVEAKLDSAEQTPSKAPPSSPQAP